MVTREILQSHSVATLKKEIAKSNIQGYTKMNKSQLIDLMMKHKDRFSHIKPAAKKPEPKVEPKKVTKTKTKAEALDFFTGGKKPEPKKVEAKKREYKATKKANEFLSSIEKSDKSKQVKKTKDVKPTPAKQITAKEFGEKYAEIRRLNKKLGFNLTPMKVRFQRIQREFFDGSYYSIGTVIDERKFNAIRSHKNGDKALEAMNKYMDERLIELDREKRKRKGEKDFSQFKVGQNVFYETTYEPLEKKIPNLGKIPVKCQITKVNESSVELTKYKCDVLKSVMNIAKDDDLAFSDELVVWLNKLSPYKVTVYEPDSITKNNWMLE